MEGAGREGAHARGRPPRGLRAGPRGEHADPRHAPLRRAAHRRHRAARGQDRRDEDRRGQDPRRHLALLPERPLRTRRARRHRERLPGPPRRRVDGAALPDAGHAHRRGGPRAHRRGAAGRLRRRHHLRPEQRVRLRLPARQHEVPPAGLRAAGAQLRHRRRGGLDPHRRGPHPAHHLGPLGRVEREVLPGEPAHPLDDPRRRLHGGREEPHRGHERRRRREDGAEARDPESLRPRADRVAAPRRAGPSRPPPLPERGGLRGQGRRGAHRRRVHRPPHAGPALVRRAPPGRGGQGGRQDRGREPDARHDLLPELLPHVLEAGRHDRDGRDRGGGVRQDLRPRRGVCPHQQGQHPRRLGGRGLQDRAREVQRHLRRDRDPPREGAAHPGGHRLGREERGGGRPSSRSAGSPTTSSTRSTTSARPRSSPRPAARAR